MCLIALSGRDATVSFKRTKMCCVEVEDGNAIKPTKGRRQLEKWVQKAKPRMGSGMQVQAREAKHVLGRVRGRSPGTGRETGARSERGRCPGCGGGGGGWFPRPVPLALRFRSKQSGSNPRDRPGWRLSLVPGQTPSPLVCTRQSTPTCHGRHASGSTTHSRRADSP